MLLIDPAAITRVLDVLRAQMYKKRTFLAAACLAHRLEVGIPKIIVTNVDFSEIDRDDRSGAGCSAQQLRPEVRIEGE